MIKTFISDDEPLALKRLGKLLDQHCKHLDITGTASTFESTREQLIQLQPELVFLDIELGGRNSFDILEKIKFRNFEVIFVTAHEQYGIKAVKNGALDYVLKPIDKEELLAAVEKATLKIYKNRSEKVTTAAPKKAEKNNQNRLALSTLEGLIFIDLEKIMYCESDGRYTRFHLVNSEKKHLVSKNLGEYESVLPGESFVRIHNHTIVNLKFVDKYVKGRGGYVVLTNGQSLPVSSRKKMEFFDKLL